MGFVERAADLVERARTVSRQFFPMGSFTGTPIAGPFTSVLVTDSTNQLAYMPVSEATAVAIGAVYSALAYYADEIGTLPVKRYRGDTEEMDLPPFVTAPTGVPIYWTDEIGQTIWSLLLRGNAYAIPTSLAWDGYPSTFYVADPGCVCVERYGNSIVYEVTIYDTSGYRELEFVNPSPDELLHLRWQTPPGAFLGMGILDSQGNYGGQLAGAFATERYAADLMRNPVPPAVLEHPLRLSKDQATDLQDSWANSVARARAIPAVLSGGIKYTPLTVSAADVQLIESRKWNATAIAAMFKLPPHYLGGETGDSMTYATVEGENHRLWVDALRPMAVRLERGFGGGWTPRGQRLTFNPDAILRATTLDRYNAHALALGKWQTADEIRELENEPPLTSAQRKELGIGAEPPQPQPPQLMSPPQPAQLPAGTGGNP